MYMLLSIVSVGSLILIEAILVDYVKDVKAGRKDRSVLPAYDVEDAEVWDAFKKELEGLGNIRQHVELHKKNSPNIGDFSRIEAVQLSMEAWKYQGLHHTGDRRAGTENTKDCHTRT